MKKVIFLALILGSLLFVLSGTNCKSLSHKKTFTEIYQTRMNKMVDKAVQDISKIPYDSLQIPRTINEDGSLKGKSSKSWTSGFYSGILWQLFDYSPHEQLKNAAILWQSPLEKEKLDSTTHDLGFKIYNSFGHAWKSTHDPRYKKVWLTAAKTLCSRYNEKIGAIRSWDHHKDKWQFPVIIDNMMNLEMLFEAFLVTQDSSFYKIANQHALTTLKNHFRKDNSSYHVVDYDPITGKVIQKNTHQGFNDQSDWSRGQAWGLYGFTVAYRYTKNKAFLRQAQNIAKFIFSHPNLPEDYIPYWDYDAPNIPNEPRDVSAAVVTASALFELAHHNHSNQLLYKMWALHILKSLENEKYHIKTPPFFLKHSVGSIPGEFEMDAPIIYADYYYVEALMRQLGYTNF